MSNTPQVFDISQATDDAAVLALLNDWPDGTPKSFNTAFTAHYDGQPSCMATPQQLANARHGLIATRNVELQRAAGRDVGALHGLSAKSDEAIRRFRQQISIDPNPQASADKQARLRGRSNQARSQ